MPGFAIGDSANGNFSKNHKSEYRRKHRWRVSVLEGDLVTPRDFLQLKTASRPNFTLAEPEVHHDQEVAYFAGKQTWEPIELTFYDAVGSDGVNDISLKLYEWVNSVSDIPTATVNLPSQYKKTLVLQSVSNVGAVDESWKLYGCWPSKSNWNDLDYSNTEIQMVNVTLRFDRAERFDGDV